MAFYIIYSSNCKPLRYAQFEKQIFGAAIAIGLRTPSQPWPVKKVRARNGTIYVKGENQPPQIDVNAFCMYLSSGSILFKNVFAS